MSYQIKDSLAVQFTKAPAIAIAGPSGSGKTESAMRLARGYCGSGKKFVVIDTEEKRALYKKARYQPWDWLDFQPPFAPENYVEVLEAVKSYPAVVLDSGSHEFSGQGGLQDIHDEVLIRLIRGDESKIEKMSPIAWSEAKQRHKRKLMSYLIRYPTLLIVCLRSEPKIKFAKDSNGKTQVVDAGYVPICEKSFMFDMLLGCSMTADNAGVPQHIKRLEPDLEPVFLSGKQIDEGTGQRLAEWAADRKAEAPKPLTTDEADKLVDGMNDAADVKALEKAFEAAYKRGGEAKDKDARARFKTVYDLRRAAIVKQTEDAT